MTRVWFKYGNYLDVPTAEAAHYEMQPDFDRFEDLDAGDVDDNNVNRQ